MSTAAAFLIGIAVGLLGYAWLTAPDRYRARQRIRRAEQHAEDCQAAYNEAEDRAAYWRFQYHGGVDAIIDRLRAAVQEETPVYESVHFDQWESEL